MKRLVQILAVTTLTFAVSTAYYARTVKQQRSSNAGVAASAALRPAAAKTVARAPAGAAAKASTGPAQEDSLELKRAAAHERLALYNDPAERAQIVAKRRASTAEFWKPIAVSMQLPPDELERLLDNLAEQATRFDQRRLECQIDPQCDLLALNASLRDASRQNLAQVLGPAGFDKWNAYREAIPERVIIQELRKNLSQASALTDTDAERLVMALADERHKVVERAALLGQKVQVSVAGFTVQDFQGDAAPKPFGPSNKEMTKDFNSRLRSRAAQSLSREQLAEFTKLQEERLKNAALMEALSALSEKKSR